MAGSFVSFFTEGGWAKLPWKNSWFSLAVAMVFFSGLLIVSDLTGGPGSGAKSHGAAGSSGMSGNAANNGYSPAPPAAPPPSPSPSPSPSPGFSFPKLPFFSQPGSLSVMATPANATVHIRGQADQPAPANFPKLSVGHYDVTVSAPGCDTATQTVEIREAQPSSLSFALQPATGTLNLTTIPAHVTYSVRPSGGSDDDAKSGKTPAESLSLPVGAYQVSLDSPRDGSLSREITISAHQDTTQLIDLVKENAAQNAGPGPAKVLRGEADASTLSPADKTEYMGKLNDMLDEYVRVGAFPQAQGVIDTLNGLGQNTQAQAAHFSEMRTGFEQKISDAVKDQISDGRLGAARSKLKAAEDDVPDDVADRLNNEFSPSLGPYANQIDAAVSAANAGDPQAGYASLQPLAQQHPDDVTVALAMAHLLTRMPPDHDRIGAQLEALQRFNPGDLISTDATDLQQMETKLQNELTTYNRLQAAVDEEKNGGTGDSTGRLSELGREIARDRASIAAASGVNNTVDSLTTGLFHTHVHVVDVSEKEAEISRDESRMRDLQNSETLGKSNASAAQQQLDAFRAQVPW